MAEVWFITGSGNGLGRDIAEAALATGDTVVAAARRPEELDSLVKQYGQRITPAKLDVRDEEAAKAAVQLAVDTYGRLDVLVNNAGYGHLAPFEQTSSEQFRDVIETCLFGVVYTTRAAIPIMRQQKSGLILQVSSIGGRLAMPGNSPYHASKWAVGGFSDSLAAEVAPFGVKVCTLEPGGIRTNWANRAGENSPELIPDYEPSVGAIYKLLAAVRGNAEGDPKKIADVVLRLANTENVPKRLILGKDAETRVKNAETARMRASVLTPACLSQTSLPPCAESLLLSAPLCSIFAFPSAFLQKGRACGPVPRGAPTSTRAEPPRCCARTR